MSESVTFNIYNAFLLTYTVTVLGLSKDIVLDGLLVAAVVGFFVIPFAGRLSDRVGRRKVFMAGALLAAVSAFPIFALVDTGSRWLIMIAVVVGWGLAACLMYGPEGAMFAEIFPTRVRYSGMSVVYQIGVLPSGAVAPFIGTALVAHFAGASWPVAGYVVGIALITVVSLAFLPETFRTLVDDAGAGKSRQRPHCPHSGRQKLGSITSASCTASTTEHRPHPRRRHGLLRHRLLRRRDRDSSSGSPGPAGSRLTQFYNTARCCPSRASLLTGLHPHQAGIGILNFDDSPDGYPGTLSDRCVTMAEVLRRAGYATYMSGKWHLASDMETPNGAWPTRRGFDRFFGTLEGAGSFYHPRTLLRDERNVEKEGAGSLVLLHRRHQ